MADKSVAQNIREQITARIKEVREALAPLIKEEGELVSMAPGESVKFSTHEEEPEAAPAKPQVETPAAPKAAAPRKRRSRKGGTRADQAVQFIEDNPGSSASDVASALKIKPNYLYRVLGDLEKEGRVKKDGRSYEVSAAA